jgi:transcriptional regulator with XRE-family HTH domain
MDARKPENTAQALRAIRKARGLSIRALADLTGVNKDTISAIERGQQEPQSATMRRLADGLRVHLAELRPQDEPVVLALKCLFLDDSISDDLTRAIDDWGRVEGLRIRLEVDRIGREDPDEDLDLDGIVGRFYAVLKRFDIELSAKSARR